LSPGCAGFCVLTGIGSQKGSGELAVRPRYDIIDQTSLDFQWTHNAWLWKLEAIGRNGQGDYFGALVTSH